MPDEGGGVARGPSCRDFAGIVPARRGAHCRPLHPGLAWIPTEGEEANEIVEFSGFSRRFPSIWRSSLGSSIHRSPHHQSSYRAPLIPASTAVFPGFHAVAQPGLDEIAPI
jgi:hypothetical protein